MEWHVSAGNRTRASPVGGEYDTQRGIRTVCYRHLQVRVFTVKQDRPWRTHHFGEIWAFDQGHLHRPRVKPGPPRWGASTLAKSYSNSVLIAIRNIYIWARDSIIKKDAISVYGHGVTDFEQKGDTYPCVVRAATLTKDLSQNSQPYTVIVSPSRAFIWDRRVMSTFLRCYTKQTEWGD